MPNFEKPKEKLVEDTGAARAAAEAENPARSYLIKNREKLSPEQQKALEWFATNEGEGAVADFEKTKENQKNIVRKRALELLKIDPEVQLADKIQNFFIGEKNPLKESVLEELNDELIPLLFKERIDGILAAQEDFAGKMKEIESLRNAFMLGTYEMVEHKQASSTSTEGVDREAYFYGLLAPCLTNKVYSLTADALDFSERRFGVNFGKLVEKLGDRLSFGHENEKLNKEMEAHNYIFNPEKNRYEKAE